MHQKIPNVKDTTFEILKDFSIDFNDSEIYKKYFEKYYFKIFWKEYKPKDFVKDLLILV